MHAAGSGALSPWRRVLACFLGVCLLLSSFQAAPRADHPAFGETVAFSGEGISHSLDGTADEALAQHCAHCGCHLVAPLAVNPATPAPAVARTRFASLEADDPAWASAPPSRPPRA